MGAGGGTVRLNVLFVYLSWPVWQPNECDAVGWKGLEDGIEWLNQRRQDCAPRLHFPIDRHKTSESGCRAVAERRIAATVSPVGEERVAEWIRSVMTV